MKIYAWAVLAALCVSICAVSADAGSRLISTSAGRVGGTVITTREVLLNHLIEGALFPNENLSKLNQEQVKSHAFIHETTSVLLEMAIAKEATTFAASPITPSQLDKSIEQVNIKLRRNSVWKELHPSKKEVKQIVETKLRAKNFIKFKVESATIPVSDDEAKAYFDANKLKFENLPFANFKDTIKAFLTKQRVDARLKDWFELLRTKYHIRNFLAE